MSFKRQLGQSRPANTSAASVYNSTEGAPYVIENITICNTSDSAALASIYHDEDGTTYDQSTAVMYQASIPANKTVHYEGYISGYKATGNVAVQSSVANALTFTLYGEQKGELL